MFMWLLKLCLFKKNDYNRGKRKYFGKTPDNGKKAGENVEEDQV